MSLELVVRGLHFAMCGVVAALSRRRILHLVLEISAQQWGMFDSSLFDDLPSEPRRLRISFGDCYTARTRGSLPSGSPLCLRALRRAW